MVVVEAVVDLTQNDSQELEEEGGNESRVCLSCDH